MSSPHLWHMLLVCCVVEMTVIQASLVACGATKSLRGRRMEVKSRYKVALLMKKWDLIRLITWTYPAIYSSKVDTVGDAQIQVVENHSRPARAGSSDGGTGGGRGVGPREDGKHRSVVGGAQIH